MPSLFDLNLLEIESLCDPHFLTTLSLTLCGSCHCLKLGFRDLWKLTVGWQSPSGLMHHFPTKTATLKSICHCTKLGAASHLVRGRKLFGDFFFFSLGNFFGFLVLTIFHAICSILELETAISTVCATVLSSNLSFSIVFSTVFATVCSMFCPFSMLFAAFLSWNLHFHRMCNILQLHSSQYLQDFGAEG